MTNVLMKHMGKQFLTLSPLLQKVHQGRQRLEGEVSVQHGNGLAKIICWIFRFPVENTLTPFYVECEHTETAMTWKRDFNGLTMESRFCASNEYLIEYLGLLALYFKASETQGGLHYHFQKTRFLGIPLPGIFSPKVTAYEKEVNGQYVFYVKVTMFAIGLVITYSGELSVR